MQYSIMLRYLTCGAYYIFHSSGHRAKPANCSFDHSQLLGNIKQATHPASGAVPAHSTSDWLILVAVVVWSG